MTVTMSMTLTLTMTITMTITMSKTTTCRTLDNHVAAYLCKDSMTMTDDFDRDHGYDLKLGYDH